LLPQFKKEIFINHISINGISCKGFIQKLKAFEKGFETAVTQLKKKEIIFISMYIFHIVFFILNLER